MQTNLKPFGSLAVGDSFVHRLYVFKKVSAYRAVNCHTMQTVKFTLDQQVEIN